jgi:cellulose synthase/poly-beta-1,6-N-acetylglucosamine synthase-like glycosyltransferase
VRLVSIVMPAYNAEVTIGAGLNALVAQDPSIAREVIVVDDGSTDSTASIAASVPGVRVISQPNGGPSMARNRGASEAHGDVIVFIDSDCEPAPDWLPQMLAPLSDPAVSGVKGAYRTRQRALPARFVQLEYEDKYDRMARRSHIDFVDTYSAAFRRDAFLASGGYSTEFTTPSAEDVDLSYRMHRAGVRMVFRPQAIVFHQHPDRMGSYLRKKYRFASWRVLAVKRNPDKILSDSHTPQLMKVQALAAPLIPAVALLWPVVPQAGVIAAYMAAAFLVSTIPFTVKAVRKDRAAGLASPVLLYLRGLAQGAGLFAGAARVLASSRLRSAGPAAVAPSSSDRSIR